MGNSTGSDDAVISLGLDDKLSAGLSTVMAGMNSFVGAAKAALSPVGAAFSLLTGTVGMLANALQPLYYGISLAKMGFDALSSVTSTVIGVFTSAMGAARDLATELFGLADAAQKNILNISEMSKVVGMTPQQFQAWAKISEDVGVSQEALGGSLRILSVHIQQAAQGAEESVKLFTKMGIAVKDDEGQLRSTASVLRDVSDALGGMGSGSETTALAVQLLGRSGSQMLPVFQQGGEAIGNATDGLAKLGVLVSEVSIKAAEKFREAFQGVGDVVGAFSQTLGQQLMPAMTVVMDQLSEMGGKILENTRIGELAEFISNSILSTVGAIPWDVMAAQGAAALNTIIDWVKVVGTAFVNLITMIPWGDLVSGAVDTATKVGNALIAAPRYVLENLPSFVDGVYSAVSSIIQMIREVATPIQFVGQMAFSVLGATQKAIAFMGDLVTGAVRLTINTLASAAKDALKIAGDVASYFGYAPDFIDKLRLQVDQFVKGTVGEMIQQSQDFFDSTNTQADQFFDKAANFGESVMTGIDRLDQGVQNSRTGINQAVDSIQEMGLSIVSAARSSLDLANGFGATDAALKNTLQTAAAARAEIERMQQQAAGGGYDQPGELPTTAPGAGSGPGSGAGLGGGKGGAQKPGGGAPGTPGYNFDQTLGTKWNADGSYSYTYIGGLMPYRPPTMGGGAGTGGGSYSTQPSGPAKQINYNEMYGLPTFALGTGMAGVPSTGPALVHQGEIIIPPMQSEAMRSATPNMGSFGQSPAPVPSGGSIAPSSITLDGREVGKILWEKTDTGEWHVSSQGVKRTG